MLETKEQKGGKELCTMCSKNTDPVSGKVDGLEENNSINPVQPMNPQVKAGGQKTIRRKFSAADKLKLIQSFDACDNAAERGAFLRKNLYADLQSLQKDLDECLDYYNNNRTHQGKMCCGRTPMETLIDGKKI